MKCSCGSVMIGGKCTGCGRGKEKYRKDGNSISFFGVCADCGNKRGRGRNISGGSSQPSYYCYECYTEYKGKAFNSSPMTFDTKEEALYHKALRDYYLKPSFYLEKPNWDEIKKAHAKMYNIVMVN